MDVKDLTLSNKYAKAYLNVFEKDINDQVYWNLKSACEFLETNSSIKILFSLPKSVLTVKNELIDEFVENFNLPKSLKNLILLLVKDNRAILLKDVLNSIADEYQERINGMVFNISSSHKLTSSTLDVLKNFLENKTNKKIMYTYNIDKELIAGIRMQSNTLMWEHSVRRQLENIKKILN